MALANDGLTYQYHQLISLETMCESYGRRGGPIKDKMETQYTICKLVVFVFSKHLLVRRTLKKKNCTHFLLDIGIAYNGIGFVGFGIYG